MFDAALRARLEKPLDRVGDRMNRAGIAPNVMTTAGLVIGIGACLAIANEQWWLGLSLWLLNRTADGLDGPIARRRGPTDFGGYFDILSDFAVYGGILISIAIAIPDARLASLVVLFTYYLSGTSFLAFSSLAAKRQLEGDGRSLTFPAGLAEGAETIAAYILILLFPAHAEIMLWVWATMVAITFVQRIAIVIRMLR